jgi:hypothetical protein
MNFFNQGILGGNNIMEKLLGGVAGGIYGAKNGNFLDGALGAYAGYNKPSSLYDRIMNQYLPNQSVVKLENNEVQ